MDIDKFSPAKHLLWANRTSGGGYSGQNVYVSTESVAEVVGIVKVSGTISTAEINALGTTPYVFNTPSNFVPISFILTATSGTTQPVFTSVLEIQTVSASRIMFIGTDPANINSYNFFGLPTRPPVTPTHTGTLNIDLLPNNFMLVPQDLTDPTAGDYEWKYNLVGYMLA
jgi:hypothetical protein